MGTDASKDPRGLVVPQVETGADFVQRAKDSIKIQFNDTVTGRYSDLPRRVIVENMLEGAQRKRGDLSLGSNLLYGVDANPQDVKAAKAFLQLPENEQLRVNMLKGSFTPDSPQGQKFLTDPKNAAKADMYISQLYRGVLPIPTPASVAEGVRRNPMGAAGGAAMALLNKEVAQSLAKNDYKGAATAAAKDVALGMAAQTAIKEVAAPLVKKAAPAAAMRIAPYVAKAARVGIPATVGAGLFMQGKTGSALDILTKKAATVVPGLKPNPQTDIGRRLGKTIVNELTWLQRQAQKAINDAWARTVRKEV